MERKIGEIFEYNGEWYQCVEGRCKDCHFSEKRYLCKQFIVKNFCLSGIIFKKIENVGEPFTIGDKLYLHVKVFDIDSINFCLNSNMNVHNYAKKTVTIELKQNKEDMKENMTPLPKEDNALTRVVYAYVNGKISDNELIKSIKEMSDEYPYNKNNIKPFSLESAKLGKPVCTRDGRKARIICFDIKDKDNPIAAAVYVGECESVYLYTNKGEYNKGREDELDLMMLPEKKEGWVNVYNSLGVITFSHNPYDTKEEALASKMESPVLDKYYVDTVKVEWEE